MIRSLINCLQNPGHQTECLAQARHLVNPWCLECIFSTMSMNTGDPWEWVTSFPCTRVHRGMRVHWQLSRMVWSSLLSVICLAIYVDNIASVSGEQDHIEEIQWSDVGNSLWLVCSGEWDQGNSYFFFQLCINWTWLRNRWTEQCMYLL